MSSPTRAGLVVRVALVAAALSQLAAEGDCTHVEDPPQVTVTIVPSAPSDDDDLRVVVNTNYGIVGTIGHSWSVIVDGAPRFQADLTSAVVPAERTWPGSRWVACVGVIDEAIGTLEGCSQEVCVAGPGCREGDDGVIAVALATSADASDVGRVRDALIAADVGVPVVWHLDDPAPADLGDVDAILLWSEAALRAPDAAGDALADAVDSGVGLVVASWASTAEDGLGVGGRLASGGLLPWSAGRAGPRADVALWPVEADHPLLDGVVDLAAGWGTTREVGMRLRDDAALIAAWSDGEPAVVVAPGPERRVVGVGLPPLPGDAQAGSWTGDGQQLFVNAVRLAATRVNDVPAQDTHPPVLTLLDLQPTGRVSANAPFYASVRVADPDTAPADLVVAAYQDDQLISSSPAIPESGEVSITFRPLQTGPQQVELVVLDPEGHADTLTLDVVRNQLPVLADVRVSPSPARVGQALTVAFAASDPDGDPVTTQVLWQAPGGGLLLGPTVPAEQVIAGTWTVLVRADDGLDAVEATSYAVVTADLTADVIVHRPASGARVPTSGVTFDLELSAYGGHRVWFAVDDARTGAAIAGSPPTTDDPPRTTFTTAVGVTLAPGPATLVTRGYADGGLVASTPVDVVVNHPPPAAVVAPPQLIVGQDTTLTPAAATDGDGDPLTLRGGWTALGAGPGGADVEVSVTPTLPAAALVYGRSYAWRAWWDDGVEPGPTSDGVVTLPVPVDTPPTLVVVAAPPTDRQASGAAWAVVVDVSDPDQPTDALDLTLWVDAAPSPQLPDVQGDRVTFDPVLTGDGPHTIEVVVTDAAGQIARAAFAVHANRRPERPGAGVVALPDGTPLITVTRTADADGDPTTLRYAWYDAQDALVTDTPLLVGAVPGETYRWSVIASDAWDDSDAASGTWRAPVALPAMTAWFPFEPGDMLGPLQTRDRLNGRFMYTAGNGCGAPGVVGDACPVSGAVPSGFVDGVALDAPTTCFAAWTRTTAAPDPGSAPVLQAMSYDHGFALLLRFGVASLELHDANGSAAVQAGADLDDGGWHHLAACWTQATFGADVTGWLWVDGAPAVTGSLGPLRGQSTFTPVAFGGPPQTFLSGTWAGEIDEVVRMDLLPADAQVALLVDMGLQGTPYAP